MYTFNNKVVWITGASSGIGEALAKALAAENAKLVLSARSVDKLVNLRSSLHLIDDRVLVLPLDLSDTSGISELTEKVISKFGHIDILINNGGVSQRALTKDTSLETDRMIMEVNFFGTIALTKSVLPFMLKQKKGHIVTLSSIAGKFGFYYRSAYSASKHALHGFFESLRMEIYKENIHVLLVCPGKIRTNISMNAVTGKGDKHNKMDESTEKGLSAEECAIQILEAVKSNKEEIFIGGKELRAVWMKRLFPSVFSKLIRKQKPE
jgi:dehydrogenase/reductase SDR family member 7B